jgi:potassium intermediate/small conductance calcium-activated channel subfamily N protein 3
MCLLSLLGIILMIIENEIRFTRTNPKDTKISWFLKFIITITTIILVSLVFYYHHLQLQLYSIENSLDNWILGLTRTKIVLIAVELIICAIHPIPRSFPQNSKFEIIDSCTITPVPLSCIAMDVALGLPSKYS